ncbi:hypothetical protein SDC9_104129 [bioreactor metagenome]|uniref:Uncharacterized protein n=1 Tax=bioreactor metagenome TaxID=1076179 RepID=A0A645AVY0_9ZZZZ
MVVGILEADLDRVVIDIAHCKLVLHPLQSHRFKLEIGHGACGVLGQCLIDEDADRLSRLKRSFLQM